MNIPTGSIPRGLRIKPFYDRNKSKKELRQIVDELFIPEENNPLSFCSGIYICANADANCIYGNKRCYYE